MVSSLLLTFRRRIVAILLPSRSSMTHRAAAAHGHREREKQRVKEEQRSRSQMCMRAVVSCHICVSQLSKSSKLVKKGGMILISSTQTCGQVAVEQQVTGKQTINRDRQAAKCRKLFILWPILEVPDMLWNDAMVCGSKPKRGLSVWLSVEIKKNSRESQI